VEVDKPGNSAKQAGQEVTAASSAEASLIELPQALSVRQLADLLDVGPIDVIKQLMRNGIMANINQTIDYEVAAVVASDFGYEAHPQPRKVVAPPVLPLRLRGDSVKERSSAGYSRGRRWLPLWAMLTTARPCCLMPSGRPM